MEDKFTLRDLIVYFIAGLLFVTIFFLTYYEFCGKKLAELQELSGGFVILSIPIFYMIGHTVSALDSNTLSRFGVLILAVYCRRSNWFTSTLNVFFNGHRIRGILKDHWPYQIEFLSAVSLIADHKQYNELKYWSFLNDTFKCYVFTFLVFMLSAFARGQFVLGTIYMLLIFLFRQRGRLFGEYYVFGVMRVYKQRYPEAPLLEE